MPHLDLLVDFAVSGRVAGVGLGSRPADWPSALGDRFFETSWRPDHLVRSFGCVDAHFEDDSGAWLCHLIKVALNEVNTLDDAVPSVLAERYGQFPARTPFGEVAEAVAAAGAEVYHSPRVHEAALETYWVPAGKVMFWVVSPYQAGDLGVLQVGDVYSVSTDSRVDLPPSSLTRFR
jgi:hypothetical protein